MWATHAMSGLSMPMPNAEVATMIGTWSARNASCSSWRAPRGMPPW